jgi:hypothetical protein
MPRLLPLPLTLQDRKYHGELAQGLVEKGVIKADQFIMPGVCRVCRVSCRVVCVSCVCRVSCVVVY